eukprot:m51a1_g11095 hypothetical protein (903) ;mRNA; f:15054-32764
MSASAMGNESPFSPTRLMFGVNNGPPHFQHCMDSFLRDLYDYWHSFVDDCICAASTFEDFLHAVEQFLSKCIATNTHCNAAKSFFGMDYLRCLGRIIGPNTISNDPERLEPLCRAAAPPRQPVPLMQAAMPHSRSGRLRAGADPALAAAAAAAAADPAAQAADLAFVLGEIDATRRLTRDVARTVEDDVGRRTDFLVAAVRGSAEDELARCAAMEAQAAERQRDAAAAGAQAQSEGGQCVNGMWQTAQEAKREYWVTSLLTNDRARDHKEKFQNYELLPDDLGKVLEIGPGPFTQIKWILGARDEFDVHSITLVDPNLLFYMGKTQNCAYKSGDVSMRQTILMMSAAEDLHMRGLREMPTEACRLLAPFPRVVLSGNAFMALPQSVGLLTALTDLVLDCNCLTSLPGELGVLPRLATVSARENALKSLPESLGQSRTLVSLSLASNAFESAPECLARLAALTALDLSHNALCSARAIAALGGCARLQRLDLSQNKLTELPPELGALRALRTLSLRQNWLSCVPRAVLGMAQLETLDLSCNVIAGAPRELAGCEALTELDLSSNSVSELPREMAALQRLRHLRLRANRLREVPKELGNMRLETLELDGNQLQQLPAELCNLESSLRSLTLSGNPLAEGLHAAAAKGSVQSLVLYLKKLESQGYLADAARARSNTRMPDAPGANPGTGSSSQLSPNVLRRRKPAGEGPARRTVADLAADLAANVAGSPPHEEAQAQAGDLRRSKSMLDVRESAREEQQAVDASHALIAALRDPIGFQSFREFLCEELSEENLTFWSDVERYRTLPEGSAELHSEARRLYDKYISSETAKFEINIPYEIKHELSAAVLGSNGRGEAAAPVSRATATTYDSAQKAIFKLMATDSFSRFTRSPYYRIWEGIARGPHV